MFGQSNVLWTPYGQTQGGAGRVAYAANGNVYVQTANGTQRVGFVQPQQQPQQPQYVVVQAAPVVKFGTNRKGQAVKYVTYPGQPTQKYYVTDRKTVTDRWGRPIQSIWYWSDGTKTKKNL